MQLDLRQPANFRQPGLRHAERRARTGRFHALVLSGLLMAAAWPAAQAQQGVDLTTGPTDYTTWTLFGNAQANNSTPGNGFTYSVLDLTQPGAGGQTGAAFAPTALALNFNQAFRFDFNWYITAANSTDLRGDGMTFTLATAAGLGGTGSDLGYAGLSGLQDVPGLPSSSLALAIDTFHFDGEPVSPSLQILSGGSVTPVAATETDLGDSIRNAEGQSQWFGHLVYTPSGNGDNTGLLTASIDNVDPLLGSFITEATIDFGALGMAGEQIFYGFTASNGLATDGHSTSWGAPSPVPEPATVAMLLAGLGLVGGAAKRRRARA